MPYLVHTAHAQLVALWLGTVGWTLVIVTVGLVEWRVWEVSDLSFITSGLAWVGIWRVCFYSHALILSDNQIMFCQRIRLSESFTPPEIAAAQVLMLVALFLGLAGNASVIYGLRNVYFGLNKIRSAFASGGVLLILTGASSLVPVCWNLRSVVNNQTISFPAEFRMPSAPTISFPAEFRMPSAPVNQSIGPGIIVGIFASVLLVFSGLVFLSYRAPVMLEPKVRLSWPGEGPSGTHVNHQGIDNPAFQS
ncbi:claudin-34-like [Sinocyclocheilus anshuiensis]|uniref:claudin-34-like n=1 Tax=Sinocyclocheilus anshuiensis TaxID=1608454 RepID=UPI0007B82407|nr:PREDICTED: claudin-34-like [Sinocyclocheilus anshuiensis]